MKKLPTNILRKWTLLLALAIGFSLTASAQEASTASLYNKALASLKGKDYEAGYPQMEEALKAAEADGNEKIIGLAKKNGAKAAYNLGAMKRKAKAYDEALTLYNRGIELNPEYSANYMGIAQAMEGKGEKVEAVKGYLTAADFYMKKDKADRAKQLVKKATSIVGKLYSGKDYATAVTAGKAHLEMKETQSAHYYVAKSMEKQKDNKNAVAHINKAVEMAAASGKAVPDKYYWAQGNILEATGDKSGAAAAYKKITGEKYKANADFRIKEIEG
ncbi:MAG: tetratricopeptide repeat protein [Bacteroidota bacterium]